MTAWLAITGLVVALVGFEATSRLQSWLDRPEDGLEDHAWKYLVPAVLVGYVLVVEGKTLASIGWTFAGTMPFAFHVTAGLAAMLATTILLAPVREHMDSGDELNEGMAEFASFSVPERLFIAGTAGVTEEVPYRGYTIERAAALTGSPLFGAALSFVAFLYAHVGDQWTPGAALQMAQPTIILLVLYLWTRSLPVVIAVHAVWDAFGLLMADRIAKRVDEDVKPND